MIRRAALFSVAVFFFIGMIVYSQFRRQPEFVSGILEAEETRVGSRIGGRVQAVLVAEGELVKAGRPLVCLEPYDLEARLQQAQAELAAREAELRRLQAGLRPGEIAQAKARYEQWQAKLRLLEAGPRMEDIETARSRLRAAELELALLSRNHERALALREGRTIVEAEYDRVREAWEIGSANLRVRQNELAVLEAGSRPEEIEQAQANAEEARLAWELAQQGYRTEEVDQAIAARDAAAAAVEVVRVHQRELQVLAPSDGIIDSLRIYAGDLVAANAPILTVSSTQRVSIRAYVSQEMLRVGVGQQVRVTVDAFPDRTFSGELSFVANQAEFTPSNVQTSDERARQMYRIRVVLRGDVDQLKPGMTANVWMGRGTP